MKSLSPKLTILTLMAGRWHTAEPFFHSLENLSWPKTDLALLWYTNAKSDYVEMLKWRAKLFERMGCLVKIVHDVSVPVAFRVFNDGDQRSDEHLNVIAALYNAAWSHVKTNDVLLLEDDVIAPSHALTRLKGVLDEHPKAALAASCVFDRHREGVVFLWDILTVPIHENGQVKASHQLVPVANPWGVRKVSCAGFSCTLVRRSRLPLDLRKRPMPFRAKNPYKGREHVGGTDLVFCQMVAKGRKEVWADYDVRPYHMNAQAQIR